MFHVLTDIGPKEQHMQRKVLFSPVGRTDPISPDNMCDGSMLHILRKRLPDAVYLYLSGEMIKNQEKDQRYTKAVEKLSEETGHPIEWHLIERPDLTSVQDFDVFYWDFSKQILNIIETEGITSPKNLLANTSSGTPAMKSALVVLNALLGVKFTLVQVLGPKRKMGNHTYSQDYYDLDKYWSEDEDCRSDSEDRTRDIVSPNLLSVSNLQVIRNFIDNYDYEAAYELAGTLPEDISAGIMPFLRLGRARALLNLKEAQQACLDAGLDPNDVFPTPLSDPKGRIFEYALSCDLKRKRGELADFIRSLSPLITDLFELVIDNQIGIDINDYCKIKMFYTGFGKREWDQKKLLIGDDQGTAGTGNNDKGAVLITEALKAKYKDKRLHLDSVLSDHLTAIIEYACSSKVTKPVLNLRDRVEKTIRNAAAHEIVSVDEDFIKRMTRGKNPEGLDSAGIWRIVRAVASLAGFSRETGWQSYEHMNALIKNAIKTASADSGLRADVLSN